jgi:methylated-DNA-[protein]-cysteine S-methyltransferase
MRCREVHELWDEVRGGCQASLREAVTAHLRDCPPCQQLYEQYEGVAYCLSCLPQPQPSCDLTKRVVEHIAQMRGKTRCAVILTSLLTPVGTLFVGLKGERIAYVGFDTGEPLETIRTRVEQRLRRAVVPGEPPAWLSRIIADFFSTWRIADEHVDIDDLTPFERAALRAAARIPPGEVRSYSWVANEIGRPRAARAVGQAMARNPLPLLFPCHRVVGASGALHNYGYGLEMKAKLLRMEGYVAQKA